MSIAKLICFRPLVQLITAAEGAGGLFDFNATLPLVAIQFILLTVVLIFVFYLPIGAVLKAREMYISILLSYASKNLLEADDLSEQYNDQVAAARVNARSLVTKITIEAKRIVTSQLREADTRNLIMYHGCIRRYDSLSALYINRLNYQIDGASQLVTKKLLDN